MLYQPSAKIWRYINLSSRKPKYTTKSSSFIIYLQVILIIHWFYKIYTNNNFLGDLKIALGKINDLLFQE